MRLIKTKLLQQAKHPKIGKYQITLEVTDYDVEMFENLATAYCTIGTTPECEFKPKYQRWLKRAFRCFWKLWKRYDKYLKRGEGDGGEGDV